MMNLLKLYARNKVRCQDGNTIEIMGAVRIRRCKISIKGRGNRLVLHAGVNLTNTTIEIDGHKCELSIGDGSVIGENCYLSCRECDTRLTIGDDCMFSRNVRLMTSDGHDILQGGSRNNPAKNIVIGNHVWLADGVTILKGVHVGDGSVVGIQSLLTSSVPANTVSVGTPAKVIKENITWRERLTF